MKTEREYLKAVSRGYLEKVIYFIEKGVDINIKDESGESAISKAIKSGYKEIVKFLLKNGADIKSEKNIIFQAAQMGYTDIVVSLLKYEKSPKIRKRVLDIAQKTMVYKDLLNGIQEQNFHKVRKAIENKADINKPDLLLWSPLMNAVYKGNYEISEFLIRNGANVNYKNKNSETALIKAVEKGDTEITKLLLQNGADINITNHLNDSPLIIAVKHGDLDMIRILFKTGNLNINHTNKEKKDALTIATLKNYPEILKFLLKKGAISNNNLLELSFKLGFYEITELLLRHEYNYPKRIYYLNKLNNLPIKVKLKLEIKKGNSKKVEEILKNSLVQNIDELLILAVKNRKYKITEVLITYGANPNFYFNNLSPLMTAVSLNDLKMIKILIENGADVNGKGNFIMGYPINIAIDEENLHIIKFLIEKGAQVDKGYGFKMSAIEEARKSENPEIRKYFEKLSNKLQ